MLSFLYRLSRSRTDSVETDLDLQFNETSPEPIPDSTDVVRTLTEGLANPPAGFALNVTDVTVTSKNKSDHDQQWQPVNLLSAVKDLTLTFLLLTSPCDYGLPESLVIQLF